MKPGHEDGDSRFMSCWWSFLLQKLKKRCSKRTFGRRFTIPKQTVHAIIKTLADKGWLELEVSEQDRRSRKLCLTAEGREQAAQIVQSLQEHEARVWLRLEVDRAEQLIEYTALYNRYFREVGD